MFRRERYHKQPVILIGAGRVIFRCPLFFVILLASVFLAIDYLHRALKCEALFFRESLGGKMKIQF